MRRENIGLGLIIACAKPVGIGRDISSYVSVFVVVNYFAVTRKFHKR